MCVGAARQALENAGIKPEEIGACVVATFSADYLSPSAACMLQRELGLPHDTVCFDLNAACSGFLFALHTMECLLAAAPRKYGLVLGAEMLSRFINWEDRGTCVLFGDGAGAVVVEWREDYPSIHALLGCHGDPNMLRRHRRGKAGARPHLHARTAQSSSSPSRRCPTASTRCWSRPARPWRTWTSSSSTRPTPGSSTWRCGSTTFPPEKYYKNIQRIRQHLRRQHPPGHQRAPRPGQGGPRLPGPGGGLRRRPHLGRRSDRVCVRRRARYEKAQ